VFIGSSSKELVELGIISPVLKSNICGMLAGKQIWTFMA
jgi:hypothetical protein